MLKTCLAKGGARESTGERGWENFTAACVAVGVAVAVAAAVAAAFYASTRKCPNFFVLAFSALGSGSARRGFVSEFVFFALSLSLFPPPLSLSLSLSFSLFLFAGYHEALILFDCSSLCSLCRCCCRCEEEGGQRKGVLLPVLIFLMSWVFVALCENFSVPFAMK